MSNPNSTNAPTCQNRSFSLSADPDSTTKIYYDEFQGQGPPSESVGAVGDIYLDTASPGLWGRCSDKWTLWRAGAQPVVHPTHETHVLWARPNNSQVSWFLKSTKPRLSRSSFHSISCADPDSVSWFRERNFGGNCCFEEKDGEQDL
ncbi:hypothetical protein R3P38DRAFT_1779502 [Favolaschia claudopus]|uniref:Uncharacterized protein n=1 Tax=Favolaschia claudopus TaxID=2862362 RepID=A0AAW0A6B5_9AGAR